MKPGLLDRRSAAGGILAVVAAGVVIALAVPTGDDGSDGPSMAMLATPSATTPTSAPPVGELDLSSNAPVDATLPPPELADLDAETLALDSSPVTGGFTDLIRSHFGDDTVEALVIVQCESQFVPWAVGNNADGSQDHGLFQINDVHARAFTAVTGEDWEVGRYDPVANTTFAKRLFDARGWEAWTCSDRLEDPL